MVSPTKDTATKGCSWKKEEANFQKCPKLQYLLSTVLGRYIDLTVISSFILSWNFDFKPSTSFTTIYHLRHCLLFKIFQLEDNGGPKCLFLWYSPLYAIISFAIPKAKQASGTLVCLHSSGLEPFFDRPAPDGNSGPKSRLLWQPEPHLFPSHSSENQASDPPCLCSPQSPLL